MRIFHVTPYYPPHLGGLQQAVQNLATAQAKNGLDVTVITSNKPKTTKKEKESSGGVKIIKLRSLEIGHIPIMPFLFFVLLRRIKKSDIIHVHFAQFYVNDIVALFSKLTGQPFVFHYHGDVLPSGPLGRLLPLYKKYILRFSLNQASLVIYPSVDFKKYIIRKSPFLKDKKSFVVPNGVELPNLKKRESKIYPNKFLAASRLSKVKNLSAMIRAFVKANKASSDIELFIAGVGEEFKILEGLVKNLNADSYIHFLGHLNHHRLEKEYVSSSALLTTAKRESFGMSIVEAMSYGLPVIAFDAPAVREIVIDNLNGLLIKDFNEQNFIDGIIKLASDSSLRKRLSKHAISSSRQYEARKVAKEYDNIYKEVLRDGR